VEVIIVQINVIEALVDLVYRWLLNDANVVSRKKKFPVPRNIRVISNVRKFEIVEDIIAIENVATDKIVQNVTNRAIRL